MKQGDRIKLLRLLRGAKQEEIAKSAGVPAASIGAIENNKYYAAGDIAVGFAYALGVPLETIDAGSYIQCEIFKPVAPARNQHLRASIEFISKHIPDFLTEQGIEDTIKIHLADGVGFFLIRANVSVILILVPAALGPAFKTLSSDNNLDIRDVTIETLSMRDIRRTAPKRWGVFEDISHVFFKNIEIPRASLKQDEEEKKKTNIKAYIIDKLIQLLAPDMVKERAVLLQQAVLSALDQNDGAQADQFLNILK